MDTTGLAKNFFDEAVRPVIERTMPGTLSHVCAGFFIPETDIYRLGYLTKELEVMPSIQIFIFEQNEGLAKKISDSLSVGLPEFYDGLRVVRIGGESTRKTVEIWFWQDFLDDFISLRRRPSDPVGYAKVSESQFYALLSGKIFWDPNLELARAQGQWDHMPQEVWYWRHYWTWKNIIPHKEMINRLSEDQSGMARLSSLKRVEWAARLAFLTARKYAPPQPMLLETLRSIADYGGIAERLSWCLNTSDSIETVRLCDEVVTELRKRLVSKQIIPQDLGLAEDPSVCDTARISDYFFRLIPSNFRSQAGRICPVDLLGSLSQSVKFAP
jgi:hypothetical protein